jgi:prepilin-type N-terminal cleavage/methylation domain-containing protein/prepilin-type processing-associated H-X9-DG protein
MHPISFWYRADSASGSLIFPKSGRKLPLKGRAGVGIDNHPRPVATPSARIDSSLAILRKRSWPLSARFHTMKVRLSKTWKKGFTLIELLVTIAIIAILGSLLLPVASSAKRKALFINEVNSAKQLMIAHRLYTDDNNGSVLPGYRYGFSAVDRQGNQIGHPISARYPWRIAPYCGNNFELLYSNKNRALLRSFRADQEQSYVYSASVFPSLGINAVFVGGDDLILPPTATAFERFGKFCVLKDSDSRRPSELLTFASARARHGDRIAEGFYKVDPPNLTKRIWAREWSPSSPPESFGFVHPRYNNRAVTAMFDGHVEGLDSREIQNMRYWANTATAPDWQITRKQ